MTLNLFRKLGRLKCRRAAQCKVLYPLVWGFCCWRHKPHISRQTTLSHFDKNDAQSWSKVHCKYIQCNFYSFYMCPTFHCNLTVLFTFNYCSKIQWNKCKADLQFFYCNFYIGLYKANTCKVYTFYMCPVSTVISLYIFAVHTFGSGAC